MSDAQSGVCVCVCGIQLGETGRRATKRSWVCVAYRWVRLARDNVANTQFGSVRETGKGECGTHSLAASAMGSALLHWWCDVLEMKRHWMNGDVGSCEPGHEAQHD